jgi:hypothetical protein
MLSVATGWRLAGTVVACAMLGTAYASDAASAVAALHAVDEAWVNAYNGGDVDAVTALYAEHAHLQPPGAPTATGRAAQKSQRRFLLRVLR